MGKIINEKLYQKGKKFILSLALIVFVLGIALMGVLLGIGVSKLKSVNGGRIDNIQTEINQISNEKRNEFQENGFSERYDELSSQLLEKNDELSDAMTTKIVAIALIVTGVGVGMFFIASSVSLLFQAHKRELIAYKIAEAKPIIDETFDDVINPNLGKITKTISKGIAQGKAEQDKEDE